MTFDAQLVKMRSAPGFIAALDQSGGSTPKALERYGITSDSYKSEQEMFDLVHAMRTRIITDPAFSGDRIIGTILFEETMHRTIVDRPTSHYLWQTKQIVPFLKIDKGLASEENGVQLMKPIPDLDQTLTRAKDLGFFGTKMRSVIKAADSEGVEHIVNQQFNVARAVLDAGLVPIIEPEVDIHAADKGACEDVLRDALSRHLETLAGALPVMFKLTIPDTDDFYRSFVEHEKVLRVAALSGGYTRAEANARLALNHGVIASFSRALTEGLRADLSNSEFSRLLEQAIEDITAASRQ